jgi:hypothetical protein
MAHGNHIPHEVSCLLPCLHAVLAVVDHPCFLHEVHLS